MVSSGNAPSIKSNMAPHTHIKHGILKGTSPRFLQQIKTHLAGKGGRLKCYLYNHPPNQQQNSKVRSYPTTHFNLTKVTFILTWIKLVSINKSCNVERWCIEANTYRPYSIERHDIVVSLHLPGPPIGHVRMWPIRKNRRSRPHLPTNQKSACTTVIKRPLTGVGKIGITTEKPRSTRVPCQSEAGLRRCERKSVAVFPRQMEDNSREAERLLLHPTLHTRNALISQP